MCIFIKIGQKMTKLLSKIDFWPTVQNEFFKISTDSDFLSEAEPLCAFLSKLVKKEEERGVFVCVKWLFFQTSTDSDSLSEAEPSCAFSSKSVKKWQS